MGGEESGAVTQMARDLAKFEAHRVPRGFLLLLSLSHIALYLSITAVTRPLLAQPWFFVLLAGYLTELLGVLVHWAGHRPWSRVWFKAHMGHHKDYTAGKFLTDGYVKAKADNTRAYYLVVLLVPLLAPLLAVGHVEPRLGLLAFAVAVAVLKLADRLHIAFHTRGHPWTRHTWFLHLRSLHYFHHYGNMRHNYAIGDFVFDILGLGFVNHS